MELSDTRKGRWIESPSVTPVLEMRLMKMHKALAEIRAKQTNGANYGVMTEDVIARLTAWQDLCSFDISEIKGDGLVLHFHTLPADLEAFAGEVYEFCPDVIEQHFACIGQMIDALQESGEEIPANIKCLVEGVDLSDDFAGMELLKRSLAQDKTLTLWWD